MFTLHTDTHSTYFHIFALYALRMEFLHVHFYSLPIYSQHTHTYTETNTYVLSKQNATVNTTQHNILERIEIYTQNKTAENKSISGKHECIYEYNTQ